MFVIEKIENLYTDILEKEIIGYADSEAQACVSLLRLKREQVMGGKTYVGGNGEDYPQYNYYTIPHIDQIRIYH